MSLTCAEIAAAFPEHTFVKELGDGTFKVACLIEDEGEQKVLKVSKASVEGEDANLPERLRREIEAMKHPLPRLDGREQSPGRSGYAADL